MAENTTHTALIGGVTGGIGLALAKRLAASGWRIAGYATSQERLDSIRSDLPEAHLFTADATDPGAIDGAFDRAAEALGPVTGYAHCVGSILLKTAHQTRDEEWLDTLALNLTSAFYALRAGVTRMQKHKRGSMVFVSTGAARAGLPAHEAIAAAKGGLEALVRSAAASYASRGVRFNCVAPGMVNTRMAEPLIGNEQGRKFSEAMHPLGRVGEPDEVASLMAWMLSDEAAWVSGETYSIDGGLAHLRQRPKL